jgi:DNA polymerase bacteriophage-type
MIRIRLDYETRSAAEISLGSYEYSRHDTTRAMCFAARIDRDGTEPATAIIHRFDPNGPRTQPMPPELAAVWFDAEVWAWNASFEQNITRNVLGWPEPGRGWRCSMAVAAYHNLPQSLAAAARFFGIEGKHDAGRKVMLKTCQPLKKTGEFHHPTEEEWADLLAYCAQDVAVEAEVDSRLPALPPKEVAIWFADNAINQRGIRVDRDLCEAAVAMTKRVAETCDQEVRAATDGALTGADLTRLDFLLDWLHGRNFELKDMKAGTISAALRRKELPDFARVILLCRQRVARVSVTKFVAMLRQTPTDSRLRGQLRYCGTQTGRWLSSGEHNHRKDSDSAGVQVQNLPKAPKGVAPEAAYAAVMANDLEAAIAAGSGAVDKALVSLVRPAVVPPPGRHLAVVDYAAIEARVVLWLAEDDRHLEWYRRYDAKTGPAPYCLMAQRVFGREIDKDRDELEYAVGKQTVLGCGFQMGPKKFQVSCDHFGIDLAKAGVTAEQVVGDFRSEFPLLAKGWVDGKPVGLWSRLQAAALYAVKEHRNCRVGRLRFFWCPELNCFRLGLPSGRSIAYHNARVEAVEKDFGYGPKMIDQVVYDDYSDGFPIRVDMYGGIWTENATQAVARDLTAEALVTAEAAGIPTVLHTHDEIVAEHDDLPALEAIMRKAPAWAEGLPVNVEGYLTTRYAKKPWKKGAEAHSKAQAADCVPPILVV